MYQEREDYGNGYRVKYLKGLRELVARRREESRQDRAEFVKNLSENPEEYREKYKNMLGWPLNVPPMPVLQVVEIPVYRDEEMEIIRLQLEVFEGLFFYGILFRHVTDKPLPLVISQHGGWGTPEFCSGFFDSENYNDMSMRCFRKGVNVFAPQLDLWKVDRFGPEGDRDEIDRQLKQLGGSIAALEIYEIQRAMDYFEKQDYCNGKFGMVGLSYGGFYTLYTTAADTRILAALSSSHFNDRLRYNWSSKNFFNAAHTFCDAEVALLVLPRYLAIEVGDNDELFDAVSAEETFSQLTRYAPEARDHFRFHVFKGVHEFCPKDDSPIDWMLEKLGE